MAYRYDPELTSDVNQLRYIASLQLLFSKEYSGSAGSNILMTFVYDNIRENYMVFHKDRLIKVLQKRSPTEMWQSSGGISSRFITELGEMIEAWLESKLL